MQKIMLYNHVIQSLGEAMSQMLTYDEMQTPNTDYNQTPAQGWSETLGVQGGQ